MKIISTYENKLRIPCLKNTGYLYVILATSDKNLRPYIDTLVLYYKCLNYSEFISFLFSQLKINESWMSFAIQ